MERASNPAKGQNPKQSDSSAGYQVNVNRTKTRKWVEASVQNYDGEDWGAEEFDEEEEESSPEPQPAPALRQPLGDRLPSQTQSATTKSVQEALTARDESTAEPSLSLPSSGAVASQNLHQPPLHEDPGQDPPPSLITTKTSEPANDSDRQAPTSPQLPDVSRTSVFGADFLSAGHGGPPQLADVHDPSSEAKADRDTEPPSILRNEPAETRLAAVPEALALQTSASTAAQNETSTFDKEGDVKGLSLASASSKPDDSHPAGAQQALLSGARPSDLPPLRTPSPRGDQILSHSPQLWSAEQQASDVTPTEPLQPQKAADRPADFHPTIAREPTFGTTTSSPVKESDALSQEIMRSLSPGGLVPSSAKPGPGPTGNAAEMVGNDNYNSSGYGLHAAARESSAETAPEAPLMPVQGGSVAPIVPVPIPAQQPAQAPVSIVQETGVPASATARRRFSWEADNEIPTQPAQALSSIPTHPAPGSATGPSAPSETDSVSKPSENGTISHQVSKASTVQPSQNLSLAEPGSPVSLISTAAPQQSHTDPVHMLNPVSPSSPPVDGEDAVTTVVAHPPVIQVPEHQVKPSSIATFKEIMGSHSSQERIRKFDETREVFASMDSGLDDWLATLRLQHPEHAQASSSFNENANQGPPPGAPPPTSGAPNQPPQQPYYQQWMNANQSSANASSLRNRIAGSIPQGSGGSSSFGSSGDKIGTKSKELMQSAGKMGKGLFSKGRSKLRGTGDKDDSSSLVSNTATTTSVQQQQQPNNKERRSSWALGLNSLGPKARTGGPAASETSRPMAAQPPQIPQPRLSPFETVGGKEPSPWLPPPESQGKAREPTSPESPSSSLKYPPLTNQQQQGPTKMQRDEQRKSWLPSPIIPTVSGDDWFGSTDPVASGGEAPTSNNSSTANNGKLVQDVIKPYQGPTLQMGAQEQQSPASSGPLQQRSAPLPQDRGVGMLGSSQPPANQLNRNSSFVGLPPVRRGSTFHVPSDRGESSATGASMKPEKSTVDSKGPQAQPWINQSSQQQPINQQQTQFGYGRGQHGPPKQNPMLHRGPALPQGGPPPLNAPRLPPGNAWDLQESHLSEPLHDVVKNRSNNNSPQNSPPQPHQPSFGYDKETGITSLLSPEEPIDAPLPNPEKPFEAEKQPSAPPVTAHRYPDLFKSIAKDRDRNWDTPGEQQRPRPPGQTIRPATGGCQPLGPGNGPPPPDALNRPRKGSGVFKDLGNRFASMGTRSRAGSSAAEMHPPADGASEFSVATDGQQQKRSSFLNMRSRTSVDMLSRPRSGTPKGDGEVPDAASDIQSSRDRVKAKFGAAIDSFSGKGSKLKAGALARSSTTDLSNGQPEHQREENVPPKKRLSNLAAVFSRPSMSQETRDAEHPNQALGAQRHSEAGHAPSGPPSEMAPPPPIDAEGYGRARRGSVSSIKAGLATLRDRVGGTKGQQQPQAPYPQPYQQKPAQQGQPLGPGAPPDPHRTPFFPQGPPQQGPQVKPTPLGGLSPNGQGAIQANEAHASSPIHKRVVSEPLTTMMNQPQHPEETKQPAPQAPDQQTGSASQEPLHQGLPRQDTPSTQDTTLVRSMSLDKPLPAQPARAATQENGGQQPSTPAGPSVATQEKQSTQHHGQPAQAGQLPPQSPPVGALQQGQFTQQRQSFGMSPQRQGQWQPQGQAPQGALSAHGQWPPQGQALKGALPAQGQVGAYRFSSGPQGQFQSGQGPSQFPQGPQQPLPQPPVQQQQQLLQPPQPQQPTAEQGEGKSSRLKGFGKRMSEQLSQIKAQALENPSPKPQHQAQPPPVQKVEQANPPPAATPKPAKEEKTSTKLLGAFKRNSKQVDNAQNTSGPVWRPSAPPTHQQFAPGQSPQRIYGNSPMQQPYRPGPPQGTAQQPPRQFAERQYDPVAIPGAYGAVRAEGRSASSPYHAAGRHFSQGSAQSPPIPQQHGHPHQPQQQQHFPSPPLGGPVSHASPPIGSAAQQQPQQGGHLPQQPSVSTMSTVPLEHVSSGQYSHETQQGMPERNPSSVSHLSAHPYFRQPDNQAVSSQGSVSGNLSTTTSPQKTPNTQFAEPSQEGNVSVGAQNTGAAATGDEETRDATPRQPDDEAPLPASQPAAQTTTTVAGPSGANSPENNGADSPTIGRKSGDEFAAKPQRKKAHPPQSSPKKGQTGEGGGRGGGEHVSELEDTEEARKRTDRLAIQEGMIHYEPEDDHPKMSATFYPGQEWNPFGEQDFTDGHEP